VNSPGAYLYVLYGEDTFSRDEALVTLKDRMRTLPAGEHNLTELSGGDATVNALRLAADAVPFLAERRMVVVHDLLARLQGRGGGGARRGGRGRRGPAKAPQPTAAGADEYEQLLAYVPLVPQATSVVFVEGGGVAVDDLAAAIPRGRGLVREFPRVRDVAGWIRSRAALLEVDLDEGAVRLLASLGGDDLRRLDNELRKLGAYANGARVTRADVQRLVVGRDIAIWGLLDALAERRRDRALEALHTLYAQGEPPEALLGRDIAPLFRRLLVAKEIGLLPRAERARLDVAGAGLNPRMLDRLSDQAARFERADLERALELLLELDRKVKTGETEPEPSLELAITTLCA
jgi:DNA polymerase III subunit delta